MNYSWVPCRFVPMYSHKQLFILSFFFNLFCNNLYLNISCFGFYRIRCILIYSSSYTPVNFVTARNDFFPVVVISVNILRIIYGLQNSLNLVSANLMTEQQGITNTDHLAS